VLNYFAEHNRIKPFLGTEGQVIGGREASNDFREAVSQQLVNRFRKGINGQDGFYLGRIGQPPGHIPDAGAYFQNPASRLADTKLQALEVGWRLLGGLVPCPEHL